MDLDSLSDLSNNLILLKVLDNLDLASLKVARLVCQTWLELSSPILLKKSCLRLRQYRDEVYHLNSFFNSASSNEDYFISNVSLEGFDINSTAVELFTKIGSRIQELVLLNPRISNPQLFRDVLFRKLPNVKRIILHCGVSQSTRQEQNFKLNLKGDSSENQFPINLNLYHFSVHHPNCLPIDWDLFFATFPRLQQFHAFSGSCEFGQHIVQAMSSARQKISGTLGLAKLSLTAKDPPRDGCDDWKIVYDTIRAMDLPLQEIKITVHDNKQINPIFTKYKDTLTAVKLNAEDYPNHTQAALFSAPLKNLRYVEMDPPIFHNFEFLVRTKDLRSLSIMNSSIIVGALEEWALTANLIPSGCHLTCLKLLSTSGYLNAITVEAITKTFPMLNNLALNLDDASIRVIFTNLKGLRRLSVSGSYVSDFGITGLQEIDETLACHDIESSRILPYIGDLQKLESFELSDEYYEHVSDISIRHGLKNLPELVFVAMPHTRISRNGIEDLRKIGRENLKIAFKLEPLERIHMLNQPAGRCFSTLSDQLVTGSRISIYGTILPSAYRVGINLRAGADSADVAFHFNPRWDQGETVLNSSIDGGWGEEEKYYYNRLYPGLDISFRITCQTESFLIELNDFTKITYRYRIPLERISEVEVWGDLDVHHMVLCL